MDTQSLNRIQPMPRKFGLCIGINDYPGTDSDLNGCVNDANDWSKELEDRGFETTRLLDKKATGKAIRAALRDLAKTAEEGDLVVVTYSGHGTFVVDDDGDEADGMDECWCPHDITNKGPITDDELNSIFSSRQSGVRWVVFSDSCHSGSVSRFGRSSDDEQDEESRNSRPRFLPPSTFDERARRRARTGLADVRFVAGAPGRNSALLMAGCQDSEYSWDAFFGGRPNGAFTYEALRVLATLGEDATYADWHEKIRERLPAARFPQSPSLYGVEGMSSWALLKTADEDPDGSTWGSGAPGSGASLSKDPAEIGRQLANRTIDYRTRSRALGAQEQRARGESNKRVLLAEGDSWFAFPFNNVVSCLEDRHGFDVFSDASNGDLLEDMAYSGGYLDKFLRTIQRLKRSGISRPKAILLSGGGNDIVGDPLPELLNHALSPNPGLNDKVVEGLIHERLRDAYVTMLNALTRLCEAEYGEPIRIITHGYDYAVPDGRGFRGWWIPVAGPWLKPGFERKGFRDMAQNAGYVAKLIDEMNGMLEGLAGAGGLEHVQHLDLRRRLPNGPDYKRWWVDELHPTKRGFERVASEFARII